MRYFLVALNVFIVLLIIGWMIEHRQDEPKTRYCHILEHADVKDINTYLAEHPNCRMINISNFCGVARQCWFECEK